MRIDIPHRTALQMREFFAKEKSRWDDFSKGEFLTEDKQQLSLRGYDAGDRVLLFARGPDRELNAGVTVEMTIKEFERMLADN